MQQIVKSTQLNPTICFCKEQPNENSFHVKKIPFLVATLYIMVHFSMFSLRNFIAVSAEKSSSLHTSLIYKKQNKSNTLLSSSH